MNDKYKKIGRQSNNNPLAGLYIGLFGIPEIGFQLRSLYFNSIINKNIGRKNLKTILDAGSGIGTYTFWLAKKFPKAKIVGGDLDKEKIEFSREFADSNNIENTSFKIFDVTKSQSNEKYDLIVNIDVLEHIEDYKRVLKNFHKLLGKGGYLYIHTPQPNQMRIFKSFKKWAHEDHLHEGYTPEELSGELKKLGFKIIDLRETFGITGKLAWELNHMSFKKGFAVAGITYPLTYLIGLTDLLKKNRKGLGTAILARKIK